VRKILNELNFKGSIIAKTHDNAANMVKGMTLSQENKTDVLEGESVRCSAHLLNLAVQDFLKKDGPLFDLLERCRGITTFFNHCTTSLSALFKEEREKGIPVPKKVRPDVKTRWNSTYLLMDRLLMLQKPISVILLGHKNVDVRLNSFLHRNGSC